MAENKDNLDAGAYEIIKKRLSTQKENLTKKLNELNQARKEVFNSTNFVLKANQRITTENNCVARGILALENICIFGYNVHFGLRTEIKLEDVFSIYQYQDGQFIPQSLELIEDPNFLNDYQNLYKYYRDSIFSKFRRTENYIYFIFQTSKNPEDLKAFKWLIKQGRLIYENDRSIHEVKTPSQFEFDWVKTNLEDRRLGKFPHVSILDKVFIEALHGDITFKIEDNTDSGKGIYSEKVFNTDQQLDDAEYYYADLGNLIAVRIKPYQEEFRAYIFNLRTKEVINIKTLNNSAVLLPDNQGVIFSNGYYLQNGSYKIFENSLENVTFLKKVASANGEDYLYVYCHVESNTYILMSYNIIQQVVETPIICNGFTIFENGNLIYFRTEAEATRHHQVQIWDTPYATVLQEKQEKKEDPIFKVGNRQIVQAMAESQEVIQLINKEDSYEGLYEDIQKKTRSIVDSYFWIHDSELKNLGESLNQIEEIANSAIDEFVKVQSQRKFAVEQVEHSSKKLGDLTFQINSSVIEHLDQLVHQLSSARGLQGEIIDLKNVRYVHAESVDKLLEDLQNITASLSEKTIEFLLRDEALDVYEKKVLEQKNSVEKIEKVFDSKIIEEKNIEISAELELLIDILNSLKISDSTQTTKIIEKISLIFSSLNEVKAQLARKLDSLKSTEAVAEFSAQLRLLEQSVTNFLELSTTESKVDEYYTKVIVQLEEIESKFSDFSDFVLKISEKRDEIIKAFNSRREQLIEQINKRSSSLEQIGLRVLKNIENKAGSFKSREEIQSFYASDLMIDKIRQLVSELRELSDVSKAENLENLLKKSQEDALRVLRDKSELFVDGENIISLGKFKFSINKQALNLTLLRRNNELYFHLTGTSFFQKVTSEELLPYQDVWEQELVSENNEVYRAEYLAYKTLLASTALDFDAELFINQTTEKNYSENYVKGVHNYDALLIYKELNQVHEKLELLRYDSKLRASIQLFWHSLVLDEQKRLSSMIHTMSSVLKLFPNSLEYKSVVKEIEISLGKWLTSVALEDINTMDGADYLFQTLSKYNKFTISETADHLKQEFMRFLETKKSIQEFDKNIHEALFSTVDKYLLINNWLNAYIDQTDKKDKFHRVIEETAASLLFSQDSYEIAFGKDEIEVTALKGNHPVLNNGELRIGYHNFMVRMKDFVENKVPHFEMFAKIKDALIKKYNRELKVNELEPKVLTSFVRNKLINQVYFPLIGRNLSKQIGEAGDNKRTARMGMLLLISPPGYGKTTLMEYLAKIIGFHFVKINGPTIGHSITSIDPVEAKTSGAREELKKINLAFEMADNVMLYLDDIQHLGAEFLQKFISLADGQRKIDGIFEGESKTYDLRGKRFCVVMAGNPYTESGSKFQIPDMLANRADVYNLGEVIGDTEDLFNLSLIENSAIENRYLEAIASKSYADFYALIDFIVSGKDQLPDLEGNYQKQDVDSFIAVIKHILKIRAVVVKVNQNYIMSAAMQDSYRTEPAFKLQGSYRNMNKLVSQVIPIMNDQEISQLILTHYESESQTLTSDTESNLLKLKELADLLTDVELNRWKDIKEIFKKNNKHNGVDGGNLMYNQLLDFNDNLEGIIKAIRNLRLN